MATVIMDRLEDGGVRLTEQDGALQSLERPFLITGLSSGSAQIAHEALAALDGAGYTIGSAPSWAPSLYLQSREITGLVQASPQTARSVSGWLRYIPIGQEENTFRFHVYSGLQQAQTQNNRWGAPLLVEHTFSEDDPEFPLETQQQIATVNFFEPQLRLGAIGILSRWIPIAESARWIGAVNSTYWVGGAPGTWLCTKADASPVSLDIAERKWRFHFEFQYKHGGWNPGVWFEDPRTGRPAVNLVPGVGVYQADLYRGVDFRMLFP
jgi:hypothetical protein